MKRLGKILLVAAFIAYPILLHVFVLKEQVEIWQLLLVFAPMLAVGGWMLFSAVSRAWWPLLLLAIAVLTWFVASGDHGRIGLLAVNGLSHLSINFFLIWLFGRTLLRGREPLISQISRRLNGGQLYADVVDYTRHVTIAWVIFPVSQIVISIALYLYAPLEAWSFFINVLNLPLLILMFVGEKTYRTLRFPNHPRTTIMQAIEVYTRDFAAPKKADSER